MANEGVKIQPSQTFDLDIWTANYEGKFLPYPSLRWKSFTLTQSESDTVLMFFATGVLLPLRFSHVASRCLSLAHPSLSTAIRLAKDGNDVQFYRYLLRLAAALGFNDLAKLDSSWVSKQEETNKRELSRLEGELRGYKNNLIRESIRMGQQDLAMHQLLTGGPAPDPNTTHGQTQAGYAAAYKAFEKMQEYCSTPMHVAAMTLRLVYTALVQAVSAQQTGGAPFVHFSAVLSRASRLRTVGIKEEEQVKLTRIMYATTGLAQLGLGAYREAASAFLNTSEEYARQGPVHEVDFARAVVSGNDIAIYGALCALATMTRDQLSMQVLTGSFRAFLELEPYMRKAISLFVTAKYQACLAMLTQYAGDWNLDIFLGAPTGRGDHSSHVDALLSRIREKSITAYFSSFSEVSLRSLAATFPPPVSFITESRPTPEAVLEYEIKSMITSGALHARLDVVDGLVIAPHSDARAKTLAAAASTADEVERTLLLRLNKINLVLAGLEIPRLKAGAASHPTEDDVAMFPREGSHPPGVR